MNPRLHRRVQRTGWDRAAVCYDRYWALSLQPAQVRLIELAGLVRGERVLDVACGTGLVTFPAAVTVGCEGHVLGVDLSPCMVQLLRDQAKRREMVQVEGRRMDAEDLSLAGASFDAVLCALGMMYLSNPARALAEMHRVLRPGGRVAVAVWGRQEHCGWADAFSIVDARTTSEVCPLFFDLGTGDALRSAMEHAGFEDISVERFRTSLNHGSEEDALQAVFAAGPLALAHAQFDPDTRAAAHADYLAAINRYRTGKGYRIPGEFVLASGRKAR